MITFFLTLFRTHTYSHFDWNHVHEKKYFLFSGDEERNKIALEVEKFKEERDTLTNQSNQNQNEYHSVPTTKGLKIPKVKTDCATQ